jgi:hypothetical protein
VGWVKASFRDDQQSDHHRIHRSDGVGHRARDRTPARSFIDKYLGPIEQAEAHCSSVGTTDVPEIAMTSPTAPGVVRRWTNMTVFADEVANARIWAGFHYRFSARVGTEMGYQVGEYVAKSIFQPVTTASR